MPQISGKQLQDTSIPGVKLEDGAVDTTQLATGAVETAKIEDLNVTEGKLAEPSVTEAKIGSLAVSTGKLAANAVTPAKADLTEVWAFGTGKLQVTADPSVANDVPRKSYVDGLVNGLTWKYPASVLQLVGNAAAATINGFSPAAGDAYVVTDTGTVNPGGLSVTSGDLIEYDGTNWKMVVQDSGGFVPADTRAILSTQTALITPYTDATDDGKVVEFSGSSNTGVDTGDAVDAHALLIDADNSIYNNQQYAFDGVVPTGTWIQVGGLAQVTARDGINKTGNILDFDPATAGGLEIAGGAGSGGAAQVKVDATGGANLAKVVNTSANGVAVKVDDESVAEDGSLRLKAAVSTLQDKKKTITYAQIGATDYYATNVAITSKPARDSYPQVMVNGIKASVAPTEADKANWDCYFADPTGYPWVAGPPPTARPIGDIAVGDHLIWNSDTSHYDLDDASPPPVGNGDVLDIDYDVL